MTTPEGRGDRLQAALRDFAGGAPPGPSAWQRLLPAPLEDPALAAIEAALDEPALAAEPARREFTHCLVERDATVEPLARGRTLPARGADIGGVRFRGTLVPEANAIGGEGEGFPLVQKALSVSRGGIASLASGAASRA